LKAKGTIEAAIYKKLKEKKDFDSNLTNLSESDILKILTEER